MGIEGCDERLESGLDRGRKNECPCTELRKFFGEVQAL